MPIRMKPVKFNKDEGDRYKNSGGFKYDVVKKSTVHTYEKFTKHFLGTTIEEAEKAYKEFSHTLNVIASSYSRRSGLDKADLFGEALIGLARAKRDFDEKRGGKFKTFAIYKIKDALEEYVRVFSTPVSIPAYTRRAQKIIYRLIGLLHSRGVGQKDIDAVLNGHIETDKIPKDIMQHVLEQVNFLRNEATRAKISLKTMVDRVMVLPCGSTDIECVEPDDRYEEKMNAKLLINNIKNYITKDELRILELISEGIIYKEIGKKFNRSDAWVVQQIEKIRNKVRKEIKM